MTKAELVDKIAEKKPGLTRKDVEAVVNTVLDSIKDALSNEDKVEIPEDRRNGIGPAEEGPLFQGRQRDAGNGRRKDIVFALPESYPVFMFSSPRGVC
jgi:hypothetical protein